ncbi:MAG TPA: C1 family peptidase [Edaphocola sp.]|nr:C1 family peptidase [Edaphocola sp.]
MKKLTLSVFAAFCFFQVATAQDNLVKLTSGTKVDTAKKAYRFTDVINLEHSPIQNQGSSGTCWSYSTGSFLESEMMKAGRTPISFSKIFVARKQYEDKADYYVRMGGNLGWGDGGEAHDVIEVLRKYGALPESAYTGLIDGATGNNFSEMQAVLEGVLKAVAANKDGSISPSWKKIVKTTLDGYLGEVPETFNYNGKNYNPKSFAKEVVGLNPDDYIEFISQTNTPYYEKAPMLVPDNWSMQWLHNIQMTDMTRIIDNALKNGYTVSWGTDVSEPYFSWPNGVAFVPEKAPTMDSKKMKKAEKDSLFTTILKEMVITPEMRQAGLDNQTTTDDHGMHIVGLSKDQNGKEYYIVKNSWGDNNDYKGYLHVTKAFVQFKSTSILVNKKAVPSDLMKKLK